MKVDAFQALIQASLLNNMTDGQLKRGGTTPPSYYIPFLTITDMDTFYRILPCYK